MDYLITIPWKGSEEQLTVLLAMGIIVGYSIFIILARKDTLANPRRSFWR
tara:strand:+ start:822 stop:971 length:150 start_codon:yes stop_codon:yes gene_type:complete